MQTIFDALLRSEDGSMEEIAENVALLAAYHHDACGIQQHSRGADALAENWTVGSGEESADYEEAFEIVWWTNVVCLPVIAVIGLACNLLNLLVLMVNDAARRMPSWHLLVALALFDSLFLVFATLEVTPMSIPAVIDSPMWSVAYARVALYIRTLASTFYKASILVVVSFNTERYLCVCRPLWAHRVCTSRANRLAIGVSLATALVCSVQWPLVYEAVECWDAQRRRRYAVITLRGSVRLQLYYKIMDYMSLALFNLLPIALLSVLNCRLIVTLRRVVDQDARRSSAATTSTTTAANATSAATEVPHPIIISHPWLEDVTESGDVSAAECELPNGRPLNSSLPLPRVPAAAPITSPPPQSPQNNHYNQQRLNANAMLFAVVLLLFVCIGPQAPARLLYEYYGQYHVTAVLYTCITQQMVFLNASLNFCLYCLVSRRYRTLLRDSVRRVFRRWETDHHHCRRYRHASNPPWRPNQSTSKRTYWPSTAPANDCWQRWFGCFRCRCAEAEPKEDLSRHPLGRLGDDAEERGYFEDDELFFRHMTPGESATRSAVTAAACFRWLSDYRRRRRRRLSAGRTSGGSFSTTATSIITTTSPRQSTSTSSQATSTSTVGLPVQQFPASPPHFRKQAFLSHQRRSGPTCCGTLMSQRECQQIATLERRASAPPTTHPAAEPSTAVDFEDVPLLRLHCVHRNETEERTEALNGNDHFVADKMTTIL